MLLTEAEIQQFLNQAKAAFPNLTGNTIMKKWGVFWFFYVGRVCSEP
jgi:hypothetical protein